MKDALKKTTQENQDLRLAVDKDAGTRTKEQEAAQKDLETKKLQLQSLTDELAALRDNAYAGTLS